MGLSPTRASIFLNDGQGVFGSAVQPLPASGLGAVAVGDLDLDGDLDALIAADDGNRLGSMTATAPSAWSAQPLVSTKDQKVCDWAT